MICVIHWQTGQGTAHNRTITQKEQIAIMNDFRSAKCNTLISTCVAEEGIDVGEVDFIVCFDVNNKNPIRFVQRIGRTGRKRQGKVSSVLNSHFQILNEICLLIRSQCLLAREKSKEYCVKFSLPKMASTQESQSLTK